MRTVASVQTNLFENLVLDTIILLLNMSIFPSKVVFSSELHFFIGFPVLLPFTHS